MVDKGGISGEERSQPMGEKSLRAREIQKRCNLSGPCSQAFSRDTRVDGQGKSL